MDGIWMKLLWALPLIIMAFLIFPRAQAMMKNSPKAEAGDWQSALILILFVVGFVILLIMMV
ncbi:MAG: hypothetical protein IME93_07735 [Proteobacteria bacterium]|nr:hypothetical protein [Pseudomonadota bacterium]